MHKVEPIRKKEQIEKVKNVLRKNEMRDLLLFVFGINTGLRISDILKLKCADVRGKDFVEIIEQKTKKYKRFPLTKELRNLIKFYLEGKSSQLYLFESRTSINGVKRPISRVQAYRIISCACLKAGIKDTIGTHTLRKTFGYHFYQEHKDIGLLQYIFNHSSQQVTLLYIGITQDIVDSKLRNFAL